jgi:hypothetical protein
MCGGARDGDPRSLGLDHDPRYLRSGSTINFPNYQFSAMMANPASGGIRSNDGFHFVDDFNPYYNRVVSANFGTARPSFSRGGSKVGNFFKKVGNFLKPVGREVLPVLKDVGKELLVEGIKGAVSGAGVKRRGRPRKIVGVGQFEGSGHPVGSPIPNDMYMGSGIVQDQIKFARKSKRGGNAKTFFRKVGNTLKKVGKVVAPVAVPILKEVGKDLLKGAIMGAVVGAGAKKRGRPKGSGGKRSNVNKDGEPKMCCFPASDCGAKPTRAGRPKGSKNKKSGGSGMSVDSAGILSVTPNPPPEIQVVGGKSNIGRKIKNTFKKVGKFLAPAVPVLKEIGQEVYKEVKPILVEEGKKQLKEGIKGAISGSGTKKGQVRKTARKAYEGKADKKLNARAEIVKKVMAEKGMKMIEASKYVKEHGLYKK